MCDVVAVDCIFMLCFCLFIVTAVEYSVCVCVYV